MALAVDQDPRIKLGISLRRDEPFTWSDLQKLPSDGFRYELIDGVLHMSPSPSHLHQRVVSNLHLILAASRPAGYEVLTAPYDWVVNEFSVFEPDLVIVPEPNDPLARFEGTPLLAIEVLSPSSRLWDLRTKRAAYEAAGLCDYWLVDPSIPILTVFRLRDSRLEPEAEVFGDDAYETESPVKARITPSDLIKP